MASLTGLYQNRLSNYKTGIHEPKEYSVFASFADGLGLPPAARQALGLDASPPAAGGIGVPQQRPAPFAEISLEYPGTPAQAAGNVASLWQADLADQGGLVRGRIDPGNDAFIQKGEGQACGRVLQLGHAARDGDEIHHDLLFLAA